MFMIIVIAVSTTVLLAVAVAVRCMCDSKILIQAANPRAAAPDHRAVPEFPSPMQMQATSYRSNAVSNTGGAAEVARLVQLRDQGVLSEYEFQEAKKKALGIAMI
jgi:hypothetical protein